MAAGPRKEDPIIPVWSAHLRKDPGIPGPRNTRSARMCVCVCVCVKPVFQNESLLFAALYIRPKIFIFSSKMPFSENVL